MNRIYANIKLPIDVFPNGEFKMLYDQMKIEIEMPHKNREIHDKIMEMKDEMAENIFDNSNMQSKKKDEEEEEKEKDEEKIYIRDYPINRIKKRMNTTFRKWTEKNTITRKKYIQMDPHSKE